MENLWEKLQAELDEDERIVYPEMYIKNPKLYDKIVGIAYLVKERNNPEAELTWVWERTLERVLKSEDIEVVAKQLIVRIRLPWNQVNFEWTVSQAELEEHIDDYDVIDVFLKIRRKDSPDDVQFVTDPLEFESNRDQYDIVEVRYLVCWKPSPKTKGRLVGINPDNIHTVIAK
jgi:hypothetical protein